MTMERAEERRRGRPARSAEAEAELVKVWGKRVERWRDSGLSAKDFANEIGVEPNQLKYWTIKLRKRKGEATPARTKRESVIRLVPTTRSATEATPARTKRESADVWSERVQRWKDSGQTAKDFGAEIGVPPHSLYTWDFKLKKLGRDTSKPAKAARTKRAPKTAGAVPGSGFELVIGNGMTLRVAQDFDEAALSRLVRVLGTSRAAGD